MAAYDAHATLAVSLVATAPSPATSGTSLVVTAGQGARFPAVPFNATIWPVGSMPDPANAEIVRVTNVATDTLTIVRAQESTAARTVVVGDAIAATVTAKTLTDIETILGARSAPATTGALRLDNAQWITGRNAANSADLNAWRANASNYLEPGATIYRDDYSIYDDRKSWLVLRRAFTNIPTAGLRDSAVDIRMQSKQSGSVQEGRVGVVVEVSDHAAVTQKTITNMTRVGTTVTVTATAHGYATGDRLNIYGVLHTFNAEVNGVWTISNALTNSFDITVAGLSSGAYTSGGTASNRGLLFCYSALAIPLVARGGFSGTGVNGDDIGMYTATNGAATDGLKITDAFYVSRNSIFTGSEFFACFSTDANTDYGFVTGGRIGIAALDTVRSTMAAGAYGARFGNTHWIGARNAAGSADVNLLRLNAQNFLEPGTDIYRDDTGAFIDQKSWLTLIRDFQNSTPGRDDVAKFRLSAKGAGTVNDGHVGVVIEILDQSGNVVAINNATNATPIQITTATAHGFVTGDSVNVTGVLGNTAANGNWLVTVIDTTNFTLDTSVGNGAYSASIYDFVVLAQTRNMAITGATNATPIVITTSGNHGFVTGDRIQVYNVGGNTAANALWTITRLSNTTFSLDTSVGSGAYTSGGIATNRGFMAGLIVAAVPFADRGGMTGVQANGDDFGGLLVYNGGTGKGTTAVYSGHSLDFLNRSEWISGFEVDSNCDWGMRISRRMTYGCIDLSAAQVQAGGYTICAPNAIPWQARNNAGTVNVSMWQFNTLDEMQIDVPVRLQPFTVNKSALIMAPNIQLSTNFITALQCAPTLQPTAAGVTQAYGMQFVPAIVNNGGTSNAVTGPIHGVYARVDLGVSYAATLTEAHGLHLANPSVNAGAGVITTYYGMYVEALTTAGTNWAVFTAGTTPSSFGGLITAGGGLSITDAKDIALATTTGTKIGTATTQKLAFYNSTPIVQPSSTTDIRTALINLGLYATGGASPLDLNNGILKAQYLQMNGVAGSPGAAADGNFWYDTTQKAHRFDSAAGEAGLVGLVFARTTDDAIASGGTAELKFASQYAIPAAGLTVGKMIRVRITGSYTTDATAAQTLTIKVKLGDATNATSGTLVAQTQFAATASLTAAAWSVDCDIVIRSATTAWGQGHGMVGSTVAAPWTAAITAVTNGGGVNTVTTIPNISTAHTVHATATPNDTGMTATIRTMTVEILN